MLRGQEVSKVVFLPIVRVDIAKAQDLILWLGFLVGKFEE
jgi:hypothetical protein